MSAKIIIIVGPTAVGKSTVINELLKKHPDWRTVQSYTTRERRINEDDSKRYVFVSREQFHQLKKEGKIIEAEEYASNWYGTSQASLAQAQAAGSVVLLDVRLVGVAYIKQAYPQARAIYLYAPLAEIRRRLDADYKRQREPAEIRSQRLAAAAQLNRQRGICDYCITSIPNDIEQTVAAVEAAIMS